MSGVEVVDSLAVVLDPEAFEDHPIERPSNAQIPAKLQWNVRRQRAHRQAAAVRAHLAAVLASEGAREAVGMRMRPYMPADEADDAATAALAAVADLLAGGGL